MGIVIVGRRTWNSLDIVGKVTVDLVMLNGLRVGVRDGLRLGSGRNGTYGSESGWIFAISLGCGCGGCGGRVSFGTFVGYHIFNVNVLQYNSQKMIQILRGGGW